MAEEDDPCTPATMTFMGSPIDARLSPTAPNKLAETRDIEWFKQNMIHTVPGLYPGAFRRVYPGFLQLASFMGMNLSKHVDAHQAYFQNLVKGDGDSTEKHRLFYDEYLAVMDLTEEFYVQTLIEVFQKYSIAKGEFQHRGRLVHPGAITKTALLTVEGENDDISGIGQTQAAHDICSNIPESMRQDYIQPGVGHYGVFSGRRFKTEIYPRMRDFMRAQQIAGGAPQAGAEARFRADLIALSTVSLAPARKPAWAFARIVRLFRMRFDSRPQKRSVSNRDRNDRRTPCCGEVGREPARAARFGAHRSDAARSDRHGADKTALEARSPIRRRARRLDRP